MSRSVFLYGTLLDPELFEIIAGVPFDARRATLPDHVVHWVAGESFPILLSRKGGTAEGVIVEIDDATRTRLDFYELGFGYRTEDVEVRASDGLVTAMLYRPETDFPIGDPWSLADWQADYGRLIRLAAREYIALIDTHSPEDAARAYPQIKMRAASHLRAQDTPSPEPFGPRMTDLHVEPLSTRQPYTDYFAVREDWLAPPRFDGAPGPVVKRACFMGGDAVTVLPYDRRRDSVLVVRQFRYGAFARGDRNAWALEPPAGRIDPGETPEEAARRELREETGLTAGDLHLVGRYYPSPAAYSEYLYSYVTTADLAAMDGLVGGLEEEAEDIMSHVIPLEKALAMIATGAMNTGPLLLSLTWLALNRERFG